MDLTSATAGMLCCKAIEVTTVASASSAFKSEPSLPAVRNNSRGESSAGSKPTVAVNAWPPTSNVSRPAVRQALARRGAHGARRLTLPPPRQSSRAGPGATS